LFPVSSLRVVAAAAAHAPPLKATRESRETAREKMGLGMVGPVAHRWKKLGRGSPAYSAEEERDVRDEELLD
jgi:hypothetical protein